MSEDWWSRAQWLSAQPKDIQAKFLNSLTKAELAYLEYDWNFWGRPKQKAPPGNWRTWLALSGRGWGKTAAGAEWIRERVQSGARSIALIAETQKDLEEVMVARIVSVHPPKEAPSVRYRPVKLTWPNGAIAFGYNGTEPDQLRGPEFDTAWCDELAKYSYAKDTWTMLQFTMRRPDPRVLVTTTPRPIEIIKTLMADKTTVTVRGSTLENAANLAPEYIEKIISNFGGTRLGRQEIEGEIVDDVPGALWTHDVIDADRLPAIETPEELEKFLKSMQRVVVSVDPSGTKGEDDDGDEVGIVVAARGMDGRGYVLADRTCKMLPDGWGRRAVEAYYEFSANVIIAETNFGGAMVEHVIQTVNRHVPFKEVKANAKRGKIVRADPVSALYSPAQRKISHVGSFPKLEDQMCKMTSEGYIDDGSPDRVDALVWALTELMLDVKYPMKISDALLRNAARR